MFFHGPSIMSINYTHLHSAASDADAGMAHHVVVFYQLGWCVNIVNWHGSFCSYIMLDGVAY